MFIIRILYLLESGTIKYLPFSIFCFCPASSLLFLFGKETHIFASLLLSNAGPLFQFPFPRPPRAQFFIFTLLLLFIVFAGNWIPIRRLKQRRTFAAFFSSLRTFQASTCRKFLLFFSS